MKPVFLSHLLRSDTPMYGGGQGMFITSERCMDAGDTCNSSRLSFPNHLGTHVDAPKHFINEGRSITDFDAEEWVFLKPLLLDFQAEPAQIINPLDAIGFIDGEADADLLLIRTGFEKCRGSEDYWKRGPGLAPGLSDQIKKRMPRLRAIGVDFISASSYQNREVGRQAHRNFLGMGLLLIEDMKLSGLQSKPHQVVVAPLLLEGLDGAPVTIFSM